MKKFLHMSIIQGEATSLEEQLTCRDLNEQELAFVVGGTGQHGHDHDNHHPHDHDDHHHNDRDDWHRHDRDDWHRHNRHHR